MVNISTPIIIKPVLELISKWALAILICLSQCECLSMHYHLILIITWVLLRQICGLIQPPPLWPKPTCPRNDLPRLFSWDEIPESDTWWVLGPVYTGPDKFLHGQKLERFHIAFTRDRRNWTDFWTAKCASLGSACFRSKICTLSRSKIRPVPPAPCKRKVEPC